MSRLRLYGPALAWGIGAHLFFYASFTTFTADTHTVCEDGGRGQNTPGGECASWYTEPGPAPFRERSADTVLVLLLGAICSYAAMKTWPRMRST